MLLFKTEVKVATDPRMSLGLFATEFIPKDSIVWEFVEGVDIKVSVDRVEQMSEAQQEYFEKYAWVEDDYYYSSCDLTNFVNHSYQPNLDNTQDVTISLRDIEPGEELFTNYAEFDDCFDEYKDLFYDNE
jgi:SET domain-containing protein